MKYLIIVLLLLSILPSPILADQILRSKIYKLRDGDSFRLDGYYNDVRLWGIQAPEYGEKGFYEAKNALNEITSGKTLNCWSKYRDKYKRHVSMCFLSDGRDIARILVNKGVVVDWPKYSGGYYSRK